VLDIRIDRRLRAPGRRLGIVLVLWAVVAASLSLGVDALVQQTQVIARCLGWANNTCAFAPLEPVHFAGLQLTQQTVCKVRYYGAVGSSDSRLIDLGGKKNPD
jgi:hypothetical protein